MTEIKEEKICCFCGKAKSQTFDNEFGKYLCMQCVSLCLFTASQNISKSFNEMEKIAGKNE